MVEFDLVRFAKSVSVLDENAAVEAMSGNTVQNLPVNVLGESDIPKPSLIRPDPLLLRCLRFICHSVLPLRHILILQMEGTNPQHISRRHSIDFRI